MEKALLLAMGIGIFGSALLTAWCLYSRYLEINDKEKNLSQRCANHLRIPANVTGHSGDRDRFAHGHHAGVSFVL